MHSKSDIRHSALLILGPTGSGKTPLGRYLSTNGLWSRTCHHFDFGEQMRAAVRSPRTPNPLSRADLDVIRHVLKANALLEDHHFRVAARLFQTFLTSTQADRRALIVLNGLPRHLEQAEMMGRLVDLQYVVHLACSSQVVYERVRLNAGGDRTSREDDDLNAVKNKLALYNNRTIPLLDYYKKLAVRVIRFDVAIDTQPEEIVASLEQHHISRWPGAT